MKRGPEERGRRFPALTGAAGGAGLPALAAALAGALAPLSFSPIGLWPAGILSVLGLLALLRDRAPRRAALLGWAYGAGFFGVGTSWVYVSIAVYGNTGPLLAGLLTAALTLGLALLFAAQAWLWRRCFAARQPLLTFSALWIAFEWLRGWLLTGFPWLYLGYAHGQTWLSGWAPLLGVLGMSFATVATACLLLCLLRPEPARSARARLGAALALALLWVPPALLRQVDWVEERPGAPLRVALVQANIDQSLKFESDQLPNSLNRYRELSAPLWDSDLVLWPETAIPLLYQQAGPFIEELGAWAGAGGASLISGLFYREAQAIHNSIAVLAGGEGVYHKQKLVPFGEYVPFEGLLSGLLEFFQLPMSSLRPGPAAQDPLQAGELRLAPYICYEVVYPEFVRRSAREADLLITISNDTWFGRSWGPHQHLQMAALRALENGRYLLRATNNGITAIIDEKGRIQARAPQFEAAVLEGEAKVFVGRTPFSYWGVWPLLAACALLLLLAALPFGLRRRTGSAQPQPPDHGADRAHRQQ